MKIHNQDLLGVGATGSSGAVSGAESRPAGRTGKADRATGEDRAELSGLAAQIAGETQGGSAERTARIAELQALVKSGRYEVNAEATARGLVEDALSAGGEGGGSGRG